MQLRNYQIDIIKQTIESNVSTLIQIPTGGGKTLISKEIISNLVNELDKQVLFVVPKIILMEQTSKVFQDLNPYIVHGKNKDYKNHKILISTIQTASKREINPDVIIVDEIHYGFEGKMLKELIHDKPNTRIIGLSATPYDKNGIQLDGFELVLDKYDIKYMVRYNYLVDIKSHVLVKINKLDEVKLAGNDYNLKELSRIVSNNQTILEIVETTAEYILKYKKAIVFAVDISHAELLAEAYQHNGFNAKALHSDMDKEDIKTEIRRFKEGQTKILVSVLMLTTGFDVPDTDIAIIARPTKSQNLYKQMVGRVLRTVENGNKTHAILLDCGNVIENLGFPLEPIKKIEVKERKNSNQKCEVCDCEKISLQRIDEKSFWVCQKCGHKKRIEEGIYECKLCNKKYTHNAKFIRKKNRLLLDCEDCEHPTLISEYTGEEKIIEIIGRDTIIKSSNISSSINKLSEEKRKKLQKEKNLKKNKNSVKKSEFLYTNAYYEKQKDTNKSMKSDNEILLYLNAYYKLDCIETSASTINPIERKKNYFLNLQRDLGNHHPKILKMISLLEWIYVKSEFYIPEDQFSYTLLNKLYKYRNVITKEEVNTYFLDNKIQELLISAKYRLEFLNLAIKLPNDYAAKISRILNNRFFYFSDKSKIYSSDLSCITKIQNGFFEILIKAMKVYNHNGDDILQD